MTSSGYVVVSDFHHSELSSDDPEWKSSLEITQISPRLFISNWRNGCDIKVLQENGIRAILCFGEQVKPPQLLQQYKDLKIDHMFIKLEDNLGEKIDVHFNSIWDFITIQHAAQKKVLVHCSAGMSRSPAAVLYFMVRKLHSASIKPEKPMTDKLMAQLRARRGCIRINQDFVNQIRKYEAGIMGKQFTPVREDIFREPPTDSSE